MRIRFPGVSRSSGDSCVDDRICHRSMNTGVSSLAQRERERERESGREPFSLVRFLRRGVRASPVVCRQALYFDENENRQNYSSASRGAARGARISGKGGNNAEASSTSELYSLPGLLVLGRRFAAFPRRFLRRVVDILLVHGESVPDEPLEGLGDDFDRLLVALFGEDAKLPHHERRRQHCKIFVLHWFVP